MSNQTYKFRGGMWKGFIATTWPYVWLEIGCDSLSLIDTSLKREYHFAHSDIERIAVSKYFPFIAYGIRIYPHDKSKARVLYFWYPGLNLGEITDALKKYNWMQ